MKNIEIYIGTAGWFYSDWVGKFYPKNQSKTFDFLCFYASYFNSVEVNSTYYAYLAPEIIHSWLKKTEEFPEFKFTIKLHQDFTHKFDISKQKIEDFKKIILPISKENKLGGVLLQFPYSFQLNDGNLEYIKKLNIIFEGYFQFFELRHNSWFKQKFLDSFKLVDSTICSIDQPQIGQAIEFNPVIENGICYVRLHGRNIKGWKESISRYGKEQTYSEQNERYRYLYSISELTEISNRIKEKFDKLKKLYVITNNHPGGNAPVNAFELMRFFELKKEIPIPEIMLKNFSRLFDINEFCLQ